MNKKWVLRTIGVVILGALGSAAWDLCKAFLPSLGTRALYVFSFGIDSVRDTVYDGIGGLDPAYLAVKGAVLFSVASVIFAFANYRVYVRYLRPGAGVGDRSGGRWVTSILQVPSMSLIFGCLRHRYSAEAITYYRYLSLASAPYMDAQARLVDDSEFALVRTRVDYNALISKLTQVLEEHHVKVRPGP